jgi:hypothetical protein
MDKKHLPECSIFRCQFEIDYQMWCCLPSDDPVHRGGTAQGVAEEIIESHVFIPGPCNCERKR